MESTSDRLNKILSEDYGEDPSFIAVESDYRDEIERGVPIKVHRYGVKEIDEHIPFKSGQLTVIVAHSNIGKSTTIIWLLVMLARFSGLKFVIYSAENRLSAMVKRVMTYYYAKPFNLLSQEELDAGYKWIWEHFRFIKHIRMYTYKQMLKMASITLESGFDFDGMLIDPYNSLKLELRGLSKHDYNIQATEEMRVFCSATGKSIFLNTHTNTEAQRLRDNNGRTTRPLYTDVEGGAPFGNKADDVIVLHRHVRDSSSFMITEFYVDKIREQEYGGKITGWDDPIRLRFRRDRTGFDIDSSRFQDQEMIPPPHTPNFVPLEEAKRRQAEQGTFF